MNIKTLGKWAFWGVVALELLVRGVSASWGGGDAESLLDLFMGPGDQVLRNILLVVVGIIFLVACYSKRVFAPQDRWIVSVREGLKLTGITIGLIALAVVALVLLTTLGASVFHR